MRKYLHLLIPLAAGFALSVLSIGFVRSQPLFAAILYAVGGVFSLWAEGVLRREPAVSQSLESFGLGLMVRTGLRAILFGGLIGTWAGTDHLSLAAVAMAVLLIWLSRLAVEVLQLDASERRDYPVAWRNLEVPGVRRTPPLAPRVLAEGQHALSLANLLLTVGALAALADVAEVVVWVGAAVATVVCAVVVAIAAVDDVRAHRDTPHDRAVELLADALLQASPEVLFYYSRPEPIGYIANVWMPTLERSKRRAVVLVREHWNADLVQTDDLPVVTVVRPGDIERVVPPSVRIALYPSNVITNNHLIRLPGIVDVFVGHGDSDKGGSATVLTRIFDEAWVSGPAARDRYHVADVGVRDEQIREIGRPQLAEIRRAGARRADDADAPAEADYAVLYAPTREGFFSEWEYSSVLSQGRSMLETLLGMPGVRVLFKPHPGTGTDDPAFGEEVQRLKDLVEAAGAPHEVVTGAEGLYQAFNRADLLVSDISSVITDFLASGKPYVVTNPGSRTDEQFRAEFPSAGGAYILTGDGSDLAAFVEDARTTDSFADARARTAAYLLGDTSGDPIARFNDAIDGAIAAWGTRAVSA